MKGYNVPESAKTGKGRAMQNLLQMEKGDAIRAVINVRQLQDSDYNQNHYLVMCTEKGIIKKTRLEAFSRPRQNGIHAITINEDDQLLDVKLTNGDNNIILAIRSGRAIHFHEDQVRSMGRTAAGVRGINMDGDDNKVVGMVCVARDDASLLVVSENGYGKRSSIEDYRITNRGGKGVITMQITEKTGRLVSIKESVDTDDLILITKMGLAIRMAMSDMRVMGRATQGVRLIKLREEDGIASVARVDAESLLEDEEATEEGTAVVAEGETSVATETSEDAPETKETKPDSEETDGAEG